jgi:hypothetical protein
MRNAPNILARKPVGKRPFGRHRNRWEDRMNLEEIIWEGVGWTHGVPDRNQWRNLVNVVKNLLTS